MMCKKLSFSLGLMCLAISVFSIPAWAKNNQEVKEAEQQISDFSLAGYGEKGKKSWEICGKTADIFADVVSLKKVVGNLYGKEKGDDIKLTAERGDFDKTQGKVHLEQDVVITTSSGAKMTTDSLDWDRNNQVVSTKDKVNIERDNMVTVAEGAFGQPNLNKVTLEKDVQVNIDAAAEPKKGLIGKDKIIITCDGPLEIDYDKSMGTFKNNVKVQSKDADIYSDIMDVYFSVSSKNNTPKTAAAGGVSGSKIDKIVARGNVKIVRGENVSYSDTATYTAADNKIVLSGRPQLIIYSEGGSADAPFGN